MKVYKFKCKNCGASKYEKVGETTYKCKYCGNTEEVFVQKEPECDHDHNHGEDTNFEEFKEVYKKVNKWKLTLLIACFFGGYFGIHRFMQGKVLSGLLYLFTGGLFGIGYFIDIVKLALSLAKNSKDINNTQE